MISKSAVEIIYSMECIKKKKRKKEPPPPQKRHWMWVLSKRKPIKKITENGYDFADSRWTEDFLLKHRITPLLSAWYKSKINENKVIKEERPVWQKCSHLLLVVPDEDREG